MPRLGQHFLKSKSVFEKIVKALGVADQDFFIEVGPGHGELTEYLIAEKKKIKILAIEKDHSLVELLQNKFLNIAGNRDGAENGPLQISEGDALKLLPELAPPSSKKWKLTGNIPYYITGKLLRTLSELPHKPERAIIMVQKEVAERMCAVPPDMNRLAASVQFWADAEVVAIVPKKDFSPAPEVDSAVVFLKTRMPQPKIEPERYYGAVRALFAQPRKTILNNLFAAKATTKTKNQVMEALVGLDVIPEARPQDLTLQNVQKVADAFF